MWVRIRRMRLTHFLKIWKRVQNLWIRSATQCDTGSESNSFWSALRIHIFLDMKISIFESKIEEPFFVTKIKLSGRQVPSATWKLFSDFEINRSDVLYHFCLNKIFLKLFSSHPKRFSESHSKMIYMILSRNLLGEI